MRTVSGQLVCVCSCVCWGPGEVVTLKRRRVGAGRPSQHSHTSPTSIFSHPLTFSRLLGLFHQPTCCSLSLEGSSLHFLLNELPPPPPTPHPRGPAQLTPMRSLFSCLQSFLGLAQELWNESVAAWSPDWTTYLPL